MSRNFVCSDPSMLSFQLNKQFEIVLWFSWQVELSRSLRNCSSRWDSNFNFVSNYNKKSQSLIKFQLKLIENQFPYPLVIRVISGWLWCPQTNFDVFLSKIDAETTLTLAEANTRKVTKTFFAVFNFTDAGDLMLMSFYDVLVLRFEHIFRVLCRVDQIAHNFDIFTTKFCVCCQSTKHFVISREGRLMTKARENLRIKNCNWINMRRDGNF